MATTDAPIVICAPEPRSLDLIFTDEKRAQLEQRYTLVEISEDQLGQLDQATLEGARYILGQPPIDTATLAKMTNLRAVLNVESNLLNNMPYDEVFSRGIHVLTTGAVFALPVAETGIAMALNLARNIIDADNRFRDGTEQWGGDGNENSTLLSHSEVGIVGFGDLGRALNRLLSGFQCNIKVYDPWIPPSFISDQGAEPATLDDLMATSDFVFVMAAITTENNGLFDAKLFEKMRPGAAFILLSRADVVNFEDLMDAVESGHIQAASDVFPQEPLPQNHRVRGLKGFIRSAHRAGALTQAFKQMGDMVLEDMALMDRNLPPMRCKRAERETARRMRSRPVDKN